MTALLRRQLAPALVVAYAFGSGPAAADPLDVVNSLRSDGCGELKAIDTPVRAVTLLDEAAMRFADERKLEPALDYVDYPASSATSFHVRGSREDRQIRRLLAEKFCDSLLDPRFTDAGFFQEGLETWIVMAAPGPGEIRLDRELTAELVLGLVNVARSEPQRCGDDAHPAAAALALSPLLNAAARDHAEELARRGEVSHRGTDGSGPAERIARAGYSWSAAGENLAAGQRTAEAAVAAWLESPGHCATLMGSAFTEMGVAFALAPGENPPIYWAQLFAAPVAPQQRGGEP